MLAMITGLHSPRRTAQVNAMDQVFGTYRMIKPAATCPPHPDGASSQSVKLGAQGDGQAAAFPVGSTG
jgi:hypothetical protein